MRKQSVDIRRRNKLVGLAHILKGKPFKMCVMNTLKGHKDGKKEFQTTEIGSGDVHRD